MLRSVDLVYRQAMKMVMTKWRLLNEHCPVADHFYMYSILQRSPKGLPLLDRGSLKSIRSTSDSCKLADVDHAVWSPSRCSARKTLAIGNSVACSVRNHHEDRLLVPSIGIVVLVHRVRRAASLAQYTPNINTFLPLVLYGFSCRCLLCFLPVRAD